MKVLALMFLTSTVLSSTVLAGAPFYVYQDRKSPNNHFIPSGWMGDYGAIKYDDAIRDGCSSGSCIRIDYSGKDTQGAGWAGIYWQASPNNWGNHTGSFDLRGKTKLTFMAKALKEGVMIDKFKIGGITGEVTSDTGEQSIGPVEIPTKWKKFEIDLRDVSLEKINGGFCWSTSRDSIPQEGMVLFLDEIKYE